MARKSYVDPAASRRINYEHEAFRCQGTTEEAAADIAAFISILFDADQFAHLNLSAPGREVHMTGESYGGRFIPVFTAAILDANAARVGAGREPINVASVMLGTCDQIW